MAKPSWLVLDKTSGTGNGTIKASTAVFTGRLKRTGSIVVTSTKDTSKKSTVTINQTPAEEHWTVPGSSSSFDVASTETKIVASGISTNSKFIVVKPSTGLTISSVTFTYLGKTNTLESTVNSDGSQTFEVTGDIGALSDFTVTITGTFAVNETISNKTYTLDCGSISTSKPTSFTDVPVVNRTQILITQKAKVVTLTVSPTSITIPAAGTAQTITVTSNDAWTIS